MPTQVLVNILIFYGCFLILSGLTAFTFIGLKAKTALISGGVSGILSLCIACFLANEMQAARVAGILLTAALFIVFSWRSTKTLYVLFEMIPSKPPEVKGKGIAFLIISMMAVVSLVVLMLLVV